MRKNSKDCHLKHKNNIIMLGMTLHLTWIGWMLPTRCNISWSENLATRMRQYNYYDVLLSSTKVRKEMNTFIPYFFFRLYNILYIISLILKFFFFLIIQMILHFILLN